MNRLTALDLVLIVLVIAVFWSGPVLARPTLPFGIRVPTSRVDDPAVLGARRRYSRSVLLTGAIAGVAVALAPVVLQRRLGPEFVLPVLTAVLGLLGYHAHRSIAAAKRAGDWYAGLRQGVTADSSLRTDPVRPRWLLLVPAVAVTVITAGIGAARYEDLPPTLPTPNGVTVDAGIRTAKTVSSAFAPLTAQILIVLLVVLLVVAVPRSRPELDAEKPGSSAAQYRTYLIRLLRLLLVSAGCANASLLVASLQVWELVQPGLLATVVSYLPLAAAAIAWVVFALRTGDAGHRVPASEGEGEARQVQRDDDRYWYLGGMVYLNRTDPAVLVHRRVGTYFTLNLGNPISWILVVVIAAVAVLAGTGVIELPQRGQ